MNSRGWSECRWLGRTIISSWVYILHNSSSFNTFTPLASRLFVLIILEFPYCPGSCAEHIANPVSHLLFSTLITTSRLWSYIGCLPKADPFRAIWKTPFGSSTAFGSIKGKIKNLSNSKLRLIWTWRVVLVRSILSVPRQEMVRLEAQTVNLWAIEGLLAWYLRYWCFSFWAFIPIRSMLFVLVIQQVSDSVFISTYWRLDGLLSFHYTERITYNEKKSKTPKNFWFSAECRWAIYGRQRKYKSRNL